MSLPAKLIVVVQMTFRILPFFFLPPELHPKRHCMGRSGTLWWRREWDSNPRYGYPYTGFRDRRFRPLSHLSGKPVRPVHGRYACGRCSCANPRLNAVCNPPKAVIYFITWRSQLPRLGLVQSRPAQRRNGVAGAAFPNENCGCHERSGLPAQG